MYSRRKHPLPGRGDDVCGIACLHSRHIGVCGVGDKLHARLAGIKLVRETLAENKRHVNLPSSERSLHIGGRMQAADDGEVFACIHAVDDTAGNYVIRRVEHRHTHVLHLGGDGKTEKDYLHDGHAQQNQHRAPVAEDMEELFSDERYELFHCLYLYLGSDNADFTDFQSAVRTA